MNRLATHGTSPIDLMENAVHDLRRLPATAHLAFLVGTTPFLLSLIGFWADMSRGALADRRCGGEALVLAGGYLWMKSWHAVYGAAIRAKLSAAVPRPWTWRRGLRILAVQAAWQPLGLIVVPLSILPLMIPLPWAMAFFRHVDALADEADGRAGTVLREAAREAKRWPGQNHGLFGLFLLVGMVVWINVMVVLSQLPAMIKMLTGLESDFTLSTAALVFNGTFLLSGLAVTYLVLMPLVLAVYARRSFEGAALRSGADLRSEFRRLHPASSIVPLLVVVLALAGPAGGFAPVSGQNPVSAVGPSTGRASRPLLAGVPANGVEPAVLNRAIDEVLTRPEFTWRERRELGGMEVALDPNAGWLERFRRRIRSLGDSLVQALKSPGQAVGRSLQRVLEWLFGKGTPAARPAPSGSDEVDWMTGIKLALYGAMAAAAGWLVWYGVRLWGRRRRKGAEEVAADATPRVPDLSAETVSAAALPEAGWLALAEELAAKGEYRLAIRAIYLAELAYLAHRELVRLADAKSNRDYARELERRARALPGVREAFAGTVLAFDRVWYGRHEATRETLEGAQSLLAELRAAT